MLKIERINYIVDEIKRTNVVKVEELAQRLNVTPMTIRRDLDELTKQGVISRTHGGAFLRDELTHEKNYEEKKINKRQSKLRIAEEASKLISDGNIVLLDSGTTVFELAILLKDKKNLTIITSDLITASNIYSYDHDLIFIGGKVQRETGGVIDVLQCGILDEIVVDISFLGIAGISNSNYLTTSNFEKAGLKRKMMDISRKNVLLATEDKFGKEYFVKVDEISRVDAIITDKQFNDDEVELYQSYEVELKTV